MKEHLIDTASATDSAHLLAAHVEFHHRQFRREIDSADFDPFVNGRPKLIGVLQQQ